MKSFVVSALKYRPSTFKSVVGQASLTATLKNAVISNKLAHAYLFCGPRGVGKTTCARIFAKTINCENKTPDGEACNQCESCISFNEQRSYSIHELDAASNNSVEDIRSLNEQVRIPPQVGKYSVYIIDEVHMLSSGAFNAFLKTLEEPPAHAIFILATTEKHKIIPTILSRCQIYDFNRITIKDTVDHLKYVADSENVKIDESALNIIAQKSDGGMRDALSIFDQMVSYSGNDITYQNVIDNLNVLDYEYYFQIINSFLSGDVTQSLLILNDILNKGFDAHHFITGLSTHLRDLLVCKDPQTTVLLEVGAEIGTRYAEQAANCSAEFLFEALKLSNDCDLAYRLSKNKRLLVELTLIKICQLSGNKKKIVTGTAKPLQKLEATAKPEEPQRQTNQTISQQSNENTPSVERAEQKPTENNAPVSANEHTPPVVQQSNKVADKPTRSAAPKRISITNFKVNETETNSNSVSDTHSNGTDGDKSTPITEKLVVDKWNEFAKTMDNSTGTRIFLEKHTPTLVDDKTILVKVDNPFQEKELSELDIINYLREELHNSFIRLEVELLPEAEQEKHLTPQETLLKMMKENKAMEKMVKGLNMEIA